MSLIESLPMLPNPGMSRPAARSAFEHLGKVLGNTVLWIVDLLDPDVVVLGGSVAASYPHFAGGMRATLRCREISVVLSELGGRAALYGAAMVAFSGLEARRKA